MNDVTLKFLVIHCPFTSAVSVTTNWNLAVNYCKDMQVLGIL